MRNVSLFVLMITAAACGSSSGDGDGDGDGDADAGSDCDETWDPTDFDPCAVAAASETLRITGTAQLDTDAAMLTRDGRVVDATMISLTETTPPALLVFVEDLIVESGGVLTITGDRPVILASESSVIVQGTIDFGARLDVGATPAECAANAPTEGADSGAGGGGGGGAGFADVGGAGADGNVDQTPNLGGMAGTSISTPGNLRAGCPGAKGGNGAGGKLGGRGGSGGGGLRLAARTDIIISGTVDAAGGGGRGGSGGDSGGGGGGSGGTIHLNSTNVLLMASATISANGGGGGGGSGAGDAVVGVNGADGLKSADPALGGMATGTGGAGGAGGAGASTGGEEPADPQWRWWRWWRLGGLHCYRRRAHCSWRTTVSPSAVLHPSP